MTRFVVVQDDASCHAVLDTASKEMQIPDQVRDDRKSIQDDALGFLLSKDDEYGWKYVK